ncbi:hypothetical protein EJB05_26445, partial [Eragrostis curvula]
MTLSPPYSSRSNMRGPAISLVFLFLFATRVQCRPQSLTDGAESGSYPYVLTKAIRSNATQPLDESKLKLIFCAKTPCESDPSENCWCCMNQKPKVLCYEKVKDCRDACDVCQPNCAPPPL